MPRPPSTMSQSAVTITVGWTSSSVTLDLGLAGLEHEGRFAHEDHPGHHEAGRRELDDVELVPEQRGGEQDRHLGTN